MDYFDRHFFLGESQQARIDGKVYELFGENVGLFNWESSQKICSLLGGHLAEIPSQDLHRKIKAEIPLTGNSRITFIGGWKVNGEWRWCRSGEEISSGSWKSTKSAGTRLLLHEDKWEPVTQEA